MELSILAVGLVIGFLLGWYVYRGRVVRLLNAILDTCPSYAQRSDYHNETVVR